MCVCFFFFLKEKVSKTKTWFLRDSPVPLEGHWSPEPTQEGGSLVNLSHQGVFVIPACSKNDLKVEASRELSPAVSLSLKLG